MTQSAGDIQTTGRPLRLAIPRLAGLVLSTGQGRQGLVILACVAALDLASIPIGLQLIRWNADFFNALQKVDGAEAVRQIGVFGILTALGASRFLAASFLRKHLQLRWRTVLTDRMTTLWLADRAYLGMERSRAEGHADNPDQRIADDCRIFVDRLTGEALEMLTACVALVTYVGVLWSLSTFPLVIPLLGQNVEIARYMIWAAPIYVLVATGMTHLLGQPLYRLSIQQQQREADYRFALARMREFAAEVALTGGEKAEKATFGRRFEALAANFRKLILRELILGLFTRPYQQTVLQIPLFLSLPAYLAGKVTLGGLMQLRSAFQNVVTTLSYFIFSYRDLVEFAAAARRLDVFLDRLAVARPRFTASAAMPATRQPRLLAQWQGLALDLPGRAPLPVADGVIEAGRHLWIAGPSGSGKTSFVAALAGTAAPAAGRVSWGADVSVLVLPQRAYLPLGGLRMALTYPATGPFDDDQLRAAMDAVGFPGQRITADLDDPAALHGLSGGEIQRMLLARVLLVRPDVAILDEATSALDPCAESLILAGLAQALPETTLVLVAHRRPGGLGPLRTLAMDGSDLDPGRAPAAAG